MTTTEAPAQDGYERLARVYDAFTAASDYEAWTGHVLALARAYTWPGGDVLDVGCGTGKSFLPSVRRGFRVTGCDSSPAMLAQAAGKAPEVRLIEADMRDLPAIGEFGLVTCFDDALNHLHDDADLVAAFGSLARNLSDDGLALFDLNTLLTYRTTFASASVAESDGLVFVLQGDAGPEVPPGTLATALVSVFSRGPDARYERITAQLVQRDFPPHRVISLMAAGGLECLGVHGVLADGS